MTTALLLLLAFCVLALTVVLVPTLLAVKRAATRAEMVLMLLEREVRPTAAQLQALTEDLRGLSRDAGENMERVSAVLERANEATAKVARVVGLVAGFTRVGRLVGTATGVKRGLDVFPTRLISRTRRH